MMVTPARYGWYGDDFTGATDTLAVLAQAGLRAMLFPGVPSPEHLAAVGPLDAIGIAGAARAMAPEAMAAELEPVGRFFAGQGVRVLHYKCCSTFDSAPGIGSIGKAMRVLSTHVANPLVLPLFGHWLLPAIDARYTFTNSREATVTPALLCRESEERRHAQSLPHGECGPGGLGP